MQCLNELGCCLLSLKLGSKTILQLTNGLDPPVCCVQLATQVLADQWPAHSKLAPLPKFFLESTQ